MKNDAPAVEVVGADLDPVYKLSRSIVFDGETKTELVLDFESLTSNDLLAAERQLNMITKVPQPVLELSKQYLALVAAKAAKVPIELIESLPAKDFSKITIRTQNFLLG